MCRLLRHTSVVVTLLVTTGSYRDSSTASGQDLFVSDLNGNLWMIDTTTAVAEPLGAMGTVMMDIAMSPSGQLFGINRDTLFTIDEGTDNY